MALEREQSIIAQHAAAVVSEPDQPPPYIYFPIDSVISFVGDTGEGGSIEVWAVGSEGLAGVCGLLGKAKPIFSLQASAIPAQSTEERQVARREFKV